MSVRVFVSLCAYVHVCRREGEFLNRFSIAGIVMGLWKILLQTALPKLIAVVFLDATSVFTVGQ